MKRLMMSTKGCGQLASNNTYFSDRWFNGVKMDEEVMIEEADYFRPEKTIHTDFCLATMKKLMKYWLGELYLVIKSTPRVPIGIPLMA